MPDTEMPYGNTLEEAREMLENTEIAQAFVERNTPPAIQWFSDPAFADWLTGEQVLTTVPPSMEEIPDPLVAYLEEACASAVDRSGNTPPQSFYLDCARHLLQTAQRYFSQAAVYLFARLEVDVAEMDADALLEAYRKARAQNRTADVGRTLVFYRLCELGALNGQTYSQKYDDFTKKA